MEFRFVEATTDLKRKRYPIACESCRKRKKRCAHPHGGATGNAANDKSTFDSSTSSNRERQSLDTSLTNGVGPSPSDHVSADLDRRVRLQPALQRETATLRTTRFVGDTHAETNLELEQDAVSDRRDKDGVGMWFETAAVEDDSASHASHHDQTDITRAAAGTAVISDEDRQALFGIFLDRVQSLIPLLEQSDASIDRFSVIPDTLALAVCLIASKDYRGTQYLRLRGSKTVVGVETFTKTLYKIIVERLVYWRDFDRLDLVRILTLLSMHQQGPDGAEEASLHLSQAIHHCYTMGLHLNKSNGAAGLKEDNARLFWSVWSLDKLSGALNGRPRMSYEIDVGLDFAESLKLFTPAGRLWLKIARLLSSVNDLYNPHPVVDVDSHVLDFPRWEFLLEEEEDHSSIEEGLLTTLELFYHSASMLSCRLKFLVGRRRAFASSQRRYLSAATVYLLSRSVAPGDLAPLPSVPYAYCLATLVAYQQYRCSQRQVHRRIAEEKLAHFQEQLQSLSPCWYAAKSMSRNVERVIKEFRRQSSTGPLPTGKPNLPAVDIASTVPSVNLPTPSSLGAAQDEETQANGFATAMEDTGQAGYGAFADMDLAFGNLMDMNAFSNDIAFALDNGFDPSMPFGSGVGVR